MALVSLVIIGGLKRPVVRSVVGDATAQKPWSRILNRDGYDREVGYYRSYVVCPVRVETDERGDIYVLAKVFEEDSGDGFPHGIGDLWLEKFSPGGKKLWSRSYDDAGGAAENPAFDLALDGRGGVFIAGDSFMAKHDASGRRLWVHRQKNSPRDNYNGTDLVVDRNGNAYMTRVGDTSGPERAFAVVKYDGNGKRRWAKRFVTEQKTNAVPVALATDSKGNVFVAGNARNGSQGSDFITSKYAPSGTLVWRRSYHRTLEDSVSAITVDRQDNVFIAGQTTGSSSLTDIALIKYDPQGRLAWDSHYDGPAGRNDSAQAVAVDDDGNAFVTGYSANHERVVELVTIKYDPQGRALWENVFDGPVENIHTRDALRLDRSGDPYIVGWTILPRRDLVPNLISLIKYSSATGDQEWAKQVPNAGFFGLDNGYYATANLALGPEGEVYLTFGTGSPRWSGQPKPRGVVKFAPESIRARRSP